MQCGVKEFSRVSGYKGHTRPTADDRRGSHLLHASRKCDTSDPTLPSQGGAGAQAPKPHPRGRGPLLGGLVCTGSLPAPRRGSGKSGGRPPPPERFTSRGGVVPGQRAGRGPQAAATGAPGPPTRPSRRRARPLPAAAAPESGEGGSGPAALPRGAGRARRMHGPTDRRTPRVADGGLAGPQPKARAPAPPGARRPPGRARPPDQASGAESLQPATPPPPSLGAPATRGSSRPPALPRGFWSLPLAVLLAPPPPPSGLSGQPERRRPWRRGFRRGGGGGGGGGGGSGGSARGAPGAANHGAPE